MNYRHSICIFVLLFALHANAQDICGVQIAGAKNSEEARQRAVASLAQAIRSKIYIDIKTEEIISERESSQRDTIIQRTVTELLNAQDAKYTDGNDKNGYSSRACMTRSNAAKGFAERLRPIAASLSSPQTPSLRKSTQSVKARRGKKPSGYGTSSQACNLLFKALTKKKPLPLSLWLPFTHKPAKAT